MEIALAIFGVAFAAFCIWLGVRTYNRRERWAKRTLAAVVIGMPVLYIGSFGVANWLYHHDYLQHDGDVVKSLRLFFGPLKLVYDYGPQSIRDVLGWYENLFRV